MTSDHGEFWIDGRKRPKRWTERLDKEWRRLGARGPLRGVEIHSPNGTIALEVPDDPGIRYVLDEVLARDCYAPVPGIAGIATIVDIGANVGIAAARFRLAYPDARILCFEPNPAALEFLRANAPRAGAELHAVGLGAADAMLPLYQGTHSSVTASLTPRGMTQPRPLGSIAIRAAGDALSECGVARVDLLKIDTEGAELPILRALTAFLPDVRVVHLEFHSEADRREIEAVFARTHLLWAGTIERAHTGQLTYLRGDLAGETPRPT